MTVDERGATAVIVGILVVALAGLGALTVDVGALIQERRELQNGADAAVLAVAEGCALGLCAGLSTIAEAYADANADDADSDVAEICGAGGSGLTACAAPPPLPSGAAGHVQVTTSTRETASGSNQITYRLAQLLTGTGGHTVTAKAAAAWGYPGGATVAPLTFSLCEYNAAVASTGLQSGPPFTGSASTIYFHDSSPAGTCPAGPAGSDLPGGFGWLDNSAGCQVGVTAGAWTDGQTGVALPAGCSPADWFNTTVLVPVFDGTNDLTGTNAEYHIVGFAAMYITGYRLSGSDVQPAGFSCPLAPGASGRCIAGHFTEFVTTATLGGPNLGVAVVQMVG